MSTRKVKLWKSFLTGNKVAALTKEEKVIREIAEEFAEMREKVDNAGGGVGGSSVQPDLSQNDPNAPDYVKNRTHYESVEVIERIPNLTVTTKTDRNTVGAALLSFEIVEGRTYCVTFDGEQHSCVAFVANSCGYIGNEGIMGGTDTGEPFLIENYNGNVTLFTRNVGTYTIRVEERIETVHGIDIKFLPKPIIVYYNNGYATLNAKQIVAEILKGVPVYYCHGSNLAEGSCYTVCTFDSYGVSFCEVGEYSRLYVIDNDGKISSLAYDLSSLRQS